MGSCYTVLTRPNQVETAVHCCILAFMSLVALSLICNISLAYLSSPVYVQDKFECLIKYCVTFPFLSFIEWVEFTPYEIGLAKYGTFMKTEQFGNKFFCGKLVRYYKEPPIHFLEGKILNATPHVFALYSWTRQFPFTEPLSI